MSTVSKVSSVSYGLLLFNEKGKILVIKRSFSYGFSSIFSMLLLRDTTAERPDQFLKICQELVQECTPEELELLRQKATMQKFPELLDHYLKGLPGENLRNRIRKEFHENVQTVKTLWELFLAKVKLSGDIKDLSRTHDIPKGRHCGTLNSLATHMKFETGLEMPEVEYGKKYNVTYESNTGITYHLALMSAKCSDISIESGPAEWCDPHKVKVHSAVAKIIAEASRL